MNESDVEKELRVLTPIKPSAQLAERIAADLKRPDSRAHQPASGLLTRPKSSVRPWFLVLAGITTAVAALIAIVSSMKPSPQTIVEGTGRSAEVSAALSETPDRSETELVETQDVGVIYDDTDEPQRQVRMVYLERHTWTNPQTGAVVEFEVPREDIVLMPVAMQ
jgi:hypothetical protein